MKRVSYKNIYFLLLMLSFFLAHASSSLAQDATQTQENKPPVELRSDEELFRDSLLMSPQDDIAINRALKGIVSDGKSGPVQAREIRLAGLSYENPYDWVLWLNGQRLVPGVTLPEIVEMTVFPDYIHLKWFDEVSNEIIVIQLRPNQVYDIQSNILLPG